MGLNLWPDAFLVDMITIIIVKSGLKRLHISQCPKSKLPNRLKNKKWLTRYDGSIKFEFHLCIDSREYLDTVYCCLFLLFEQKQSHKNV